MPEQSAGLVPALAEVAGLPDVCRKLARDRIPEIIKSEGHRPVTRMLDEASYRQALLAKLIEEAREASHATADDLPGELPDVLEVLRALTGTAGMSWAQRLLLADDKRSRRGGFGAGSSSNQRSKTTARLNRLPVRRGLPSCRIAGVGRMDTHASFGILIRGSVDLAAPATSLPRILKGVTADQCVAAL